MVKFVDRVKMNLTTTGTGTVTFGSVVSGFQNLADASVVDADAVRYTIESGTSYESGTGTIGLTGSTYTMARSPSSSSESDNSAINLAAGAVCFLTMLAEDVVQNLADLDNVSSTAPAGGQNLSWDSSTSSWAPSSPSGGITSVGNYAGLPASPSETDLAWVSDQKALYVYDGTEWDRVSTGSQVSPRFTTTPPVDHSLSSSGQTSAITTVAVDDAGFPITYDWDGFSGSTTYNSSSLPNQITNVSESNGVFTLTPSSNTSHAGNFTFRTKASDGVLTATSNTNVVLGFGLVDCYGFRMSQTYPTSGLFILYYLLLDSGGTNMWDDSSFVSDCTFNSVTYDHLVATYTNSDTTYAPGFVKAQQTELFGTTMANLNSYKVALVAGSRSEVLDVTWTTPKSIGAVILSGVHATTGATYWQNGDIRPYIGGNATSDLVAAGTYTSTSSPPLTDSTASGYTGTNNKFIDFTA